METLKEIHKFSSNHRASIEKSKWCGCFYCQKHLFASKIKKWVDDGQTAICPNCGIDAVLGDYDCGEITPDLLEMMQEEYFPSLYWEKVPNRILTSMLLCSFRYSLGRTSYIVSECCDWLKLYWDKMPEGWQRQIHEDIERAIEKGYAGDPCDVKSWKEILKLKVKEQSVGRKSTEKINR